MKRVFLTILLAAMAHPLSAQELLSRVETRKVDGNGLFKVDVSFAVGELLVRPADGRLYRVAMDYADVFDPTIRFDPAGRSLSIKLDGEGGLHGEDLEDLGQRLSLDLPRNVPLDLTLEFGALEADIDLGELMLRTGKIRAGASHTTVSFSGATRGVCERLDFEVGAAEFEALQLGNSGCREISLKGAVGEMTLDFSGERLASETRLFIKVGLGEVRLRIPEAVGILLNADRFLASVSRAGLVKQGSAFVSPGYDGAKAKLIIEVDAALGSVEIERFR
ncbi:MAG: cell wall-active antibiotics response protein [Gemmatimonadota bacterium]|nr:cell wall-active antibiotics response protein [Gemmatimonadota bacterium]